MINRISLKKFLRAKINNGRIVYHKGLERGPPSLNPLLDTILVVSGLNPHRLNSSIVN